MSAKFWAMVNKDGPVIRPELGPCWEWTGLRRHPGYGVVSWAPEGTSRVASRVSWELVNGPIPDRLFACHKCDNPPCVRPSHLFLGTQRDNMRDCADKGRSRNVLTDVQAIACRLASWLGVAGTMKLARAYGVKPSVIGHLLRGDTYRHLPGAHSVSHRKRGVRTVNLSPAEVQRLCSLRKAGRTVDSLVAEFGASRGTIYRLTRAFLTETKGET
jgi:HNH endonuclease